MKKRKGFTLIELMTVITISAYVMAMSMTIYNTLKRSMRRDRAQSNVENFIDGVNVELTRTFGSMTGVNQQTNIDTTLKFKGAGYDDEWGYLASDTYTQGFATLAPFINIVDTGGVPFGDVRVLLTFHFKNPMEKLLANQVSYYRALGISNIDGDGNMTAKSNLVYIELDPKDGNRVVRKLAVKPSRTWIRRIEVAKVANQGKTLVISIEVRSYLYKPKDIEDVNRTQYPQNYSGTKVFTMVIRSN